MPISDDPHSGHRQRLRERFLAFKANGLSEAELLELLLAYAIPRRDVASLARGLLARFGALAGVLSASHEELLAVPGIGEQAATLLQLVGRLTDLNRPPARAVPPTKEPYVNVEVEPDLEPPFDENAKAVQFRTFTNDLSATALEYLPRIASFDTMDRFQSFLEQNLPYNSQTSRKRYARNLINRYYPSGVVQTPLTTLLRYGPGIDTLRPVLFYETVRAEPTVRFVAEELVWPALPAGHLSRALLRERLQTIFLVSPATLSRMVYSLFSVYTVLNQGRTDGEELRFQVHHGTFEAFLYVLTAEFPEPGMYRFEELEEGPMRRWLMWDREWMHRQLYNLRDVGILTKVSQIDTLRQFTLQFDQETALRHYFEHPERKNLVLREGPTNGSGDQKEELP